MTLLHAFRTAAMPNGDPATDEPRRVAAEVLYEEMRRLATARRIPGVEPDDVVHDKLLGLLQAGPRGERHHEPDTDQGVRNWLAKALWRKTIDLNRKAVATHEAPLDLANDLPSLEQSPDNELIRQHLKDETLTGLVEHVASGLRQDGARNFRQSVSELVQIRQGNLSIDGILMTAGGGSVDAIYKRHSRARRALLAGVGEYQQTAGLDDWKTAALRILVDSLRIR